MLKVLLILITIIMGISSGCGQTIGSVNTADEPIVSKLPDYDWRNTQWTFGDLSVSPNKANVREKVLVEAYIYIPGIVERMGIAYITLNGKLWDKQQFLFYGDEIIPVQFYVTVAQAGTYRIEFGAYIADDTSYTIGQDTLAATLTVS